LRAILSFLLVLCALPALADFLPVGIGYAFNRRHDQSPYYDGQVGNYAWLKPGELRVPGTGVPFRVEGDNPANPSIALTGGSRNDLPQAISLFPYVAGVAKIHLLGIAGGWVHGQTGEEAGAVVLVFADGTEQRFPLRIGIEIDDWVHHAATGVAVAANAPAGGSHVDALSLAVAGDPGRVLCEVRIESVPSVSIPVFALTVEGPNPGQPDQAVAVARHDVARDIAALHEGLRLIAERGFGEEAQSLRTRLAAIPEPTTAGLPQLIPARVELARLAAELDTYRHRHRFTKTPDENAPGFPSRRDYSILLERIPLWAERGWHDAYGSDPGVGYFGEGGTNENSLRTLGNFIFAYAFLATDPYYDASVSGVPQSQLLAQTRAALAYMTRTHFTGDLVCADGKKWGNHWQSAWWTSRMVAGARLIWEQLTNAERDAVRRVLVAEANRHLDRTPPGGEFSNTRSEENAWDSEVLVWATTVCPAHPNARQWEAKAREFFMNTLSVKADAEDDSLVDGRPVRQQVVTVNVHSDFTIENHGSYQFCYMACPLHSLAWSYYAYREANRQPPEALFHHYQDVWNVIKRTQLYDGRFAYLGGKDWARYVYGLYFIMPPLVVLQEKYGDQDARLLERQRFRTFEWEQRLHGDGGMFSGRFTHGVMRGWPHEYETDAMALLALCACLHGDRTPLAPSDPAEVQQRLTGAMRSEPCEWQMARSPQAFTAFSWRLLQKGACMGVFAPAGGDDLVEWGRDNFVSQISVAGKPLAVLKTEHADQLLEDGFHTTGRATRGTDPKGAPAVEQFLHVTALPQHGVMVVLDWARTLGTQQAVTSFGLNHYLPNDIFNGNSRQLAWADGQATVAGVGNAQPNVTGTTSWLCVDDRLGIASPAPAPFQLVLSASRNAPWGSLCYDSLHWPDQSAPRELADGAIIHDHAYLLAAGNATLAAHLAGQFERLPNPNPGLRLVRFAGADGQRFLLAVNFATAPTETTVAGETLALPPQGAVLKTVP